MPFFFIIFGVVAMYAYFDNKKSENPFPLIVLLFGAVLTGAGVISFL